MPGKTLGFLLTAFLLGAILPLSAAPVNLTLDNNHTYVRWSIQHLGFSTQTGKWYANGQLIIDKDHPENSKVSVTIKVADVITGLPELDQHLRGPLFFDTEKYPTATFISNKVDVLSKTKAKVYGLLTLHGVTKPVILNVILNKTGKNPLNDKMTAGFTATTIIKRSEFGMTTLPDKLSDEVAIEIGVEAYLGTP